jgi:hypothetical protein
MTANRPAEWRTPIKHALIIGGLFLAASAAIGFLAPEHISEELSRRLMGVMLGALVVYYANAAPRALTPLARLRCDPAAEQAFRRFFGWTLVLGGVAYMLAYIVAPLDVADVVATALLGAAMLVIVARMIWMKTRGSRA